MSEDFTARATCEAYYKFENASDLGEDNQNQIDLTNNNGVTQSSTIPSGTYASPSATKSADFESGSSQSLTAPHNNAQAIDNLTAWTFLTWFRPESLDAFMLVDFDDGGCSGGWRIYVPAANEIDVCFGGTHKNIADTLENGKWSFIAATYDQDDDTIRIFYGEEETQVSESDTIAAVDKTASATVDFALGVYISDPQLYADGLYCETVVFSEKLTLSEIQEIQADGMEGAVTGYSHYYIMNQFKLDWEKIFPRPRLGKLWKPNPGLAIAKVKGG